ncbi:AAA family ATPase [Streptomyces pseudovenezuelae]|uniref:AAA family ATPase n=1 Tax=Streptomyces pseudovenezuelae TaxID=67350 RepID=UPI0036F18891
MTDRRGTPRTGRKSVPRPLRTLPSDAKNTAPQTRARFEYQDECAAVLVLDHLSDDLEGILVEHSTDVILLPSSGVPELISIKHREPNRSGDANWSWSALRKDNVLKDLYDTWIASGKVCTVAFCSNAGFSGTAHELWLAATKQQSAKPDLLAKLAHLVGTNVTESAEFLESLALPLNPLPRRNEITAVGVQKTADYLRANGRNPNFAASSYEALVHAIRQAGTELPDARKSPTRNPFPTIREQLSKLASVTQEERYLSQSNLQHLVIFESDRLAAGDLEGLHPGPAEDPLFTGRSHEMEELRRLLRVDDIGRVSPVVLHGLTGIGKTSLAAQFAAEHAQKFRTFIVDGSSRASLLESLSLIDGISDHAPGDISVAHNVTSPTLVDSSAILLIVDGVTNSEAIHGIIPRQSFTRILITSTVHHLDDGFEHLELKSWTAEESICFLSKSLRPELADSVGELVSCLAGHPLAFSQAVNYCNTSRIPISEYTKRLHARSLDMLDLGEAAQHPKTLTKSILLALDAVDSTNPLAGHLLRIFSFLGTEPTPVSLLAEEPLRPWVTNGDEKLSVKKFPWQKTKLPNWGGFVAENIGWESRCALADDLQRDAAISTLGSYALVSVDYGHILIHPLVQLVVREVQSDRAPWVEAAIGLVANMLPMNRTTASIAMYRYTGHVKSAVQHALAEGFTGPAVLFSAVALCDELLTLGDTVEAVPLAREIRDIAYGLIPLGFIQPAHFFKITQTLASALAMNGDTTEAIRSTKANLALVMKRYPDDAKSKLMAYADLGRMACISHNRDLAERTLPHLIDPCSSDAEYSSVQIGTQLLAAHVRFNILLLLNRPDEAAQVNEWSMRKLSEGDLDAESSPLAAAIYGDAAALALHSRDPRLRIKNQQSFVEVKGKENRHSARYLEGILDLADSYLDELNVSAAEPLIAEAGDRLDSANQQRSPLYTKYLAFRGRLRAIKSTPGEPSLALAESDLREALNRIESEPRDIGLSAVLLSSVLINLAETYALMGDEERALATAQQALQIDRERYEEGHPEIQIDEEIIAMIPAEAQAARAIIRRNKKSK